MEYGTDTSFKEKVEVSRARTLLLTRSRLDRLSEQSPCPFSHHTTNEDWQEPELEQIRLEPLAGDLDHFAIHEGARL